MDSCKILAMTLADLWSENRKANQKLKDIHYFDAQIHDNGLKTSEDQTIVLSKEIENQKQEVTNLKKKLVDLTNGIEELKGEKEELSKTLDEKDSRLDSLEKAVEQNKINQEKEMKEFNESRAKNIQKLEDEIDEAENSFKKQITEINEVNKRLHQDIKTMKTKNDVMKNELTLKECQSYIGEVCLNLQANMYHIVLPNQFAEDCPYKIKDIEEDIEDEDLLNDEERQEASKRWEDLKEKLRWNPSLERTLKMLQKEGNPMDHPDLTVEEAKRVVEELNKQGRLRGITSYEKVQKLIEMWNVSVTLVQSLP